jgi:nucleoside-diphosphate-sugar epimerase
MRVLVVGASGVLGSRLLPLLVADGHEVGGTTRTPAKGDLIAAAGARPLVADVYDAGAFVATVIDFAPEVLVDLLTDLPDAAAEIRERLAANSRIRREGTATVLGAAAAAGARRVLVESVAWSIPGEGGRAVEHLERITLEAGGVVLRYGQFYGPGTYHEDAPPPPPRIHIGAAAERTARLLDAAPSIVEIVEADQGSAGSPRPDHPDGARRFEDRSDRASPIL